METKITHATLFGSSIWTVHYYSQFSKRWVVAGQFDRHADACVEADSWGDPIQTRLRTGGGNA